MAHKHDHPILRTIGGAAVGLIVGAIISVNIVIYSGMDSGYESSPGQVFSQKPLIGLSAAAALILGPLVGGYLAYRTSRR